MWPKDATNLAIFDVRCHARRSTTTEDSPRDVDGEELLILWKTSKCTFIALPGKGCLARSLQLWNTISDKDLVSAAGKKLFCEPFDPSQKLHAFAAFAQRLLLELVESSATSSIARDAVQSHMRILTDIENSFTFTECPSEPAPPHALCSGVMRITPTPLELSSMSLYCMALSMTLVPVGSCVPASCFC